MSTRVWPRSVTQERTTIMASARLMSRLLHGSGDAFGVEDHALDGGRIHGSGIGCENDRASVVRVQLENARPRLGAVIDGNRLRRVRRAVPRGDDVDLQAGSEQL